MTEEVDSFTPCGASIIIATLLLITIFTHRRLAQFDDLKMASQDPNPQGGSLTDMAVEGTNVPDDAGTQRTIPSVPRPDQITDPNTDPNDLGASDLAGAADNAQDISRVRDQLLPLLSTCLQKTSI